MWAQWAGWRWMIFQSSLMSMAEISLRGTMMFSTVILSRSGCLSASPGGAWEEIARLVDDGAQLFGIEGVILVVL